MALPSAVINICACGLRLVVFRHSAARNIQDDELAALFSPVFSRLVCYAGGDAFPLLPHVCSPGPTSACLVCKPDGESGPAWADAFQRSKQSFYGRPPAMAQLSILRAAVEAPSSSGVACRGIASPKIEACKDKRKESEKRQRESPPMWLGSAARIPVLRLHGGTHTMTLCSSADSLPFRGMAPHQ